MITQELLKDFVKYNELTGDFYWLRNTLRHREGEKAGISRKSGYLRICINGIRYESHRLAWLYVYGVMPKGVIDHINGNPFDNKISNLRDCTQSDNAKNMKIKSVNTSGYIGVSYDKTRDKWLAQGRYNGKKKNLGRFETKEQAADAYVNFAKNHYGEFYRELAA